MHFSNELGLSKHAIRSSENEPFENWMVCEHAGQHAKRALMHKKYINNEMEFTRLSIKWVSRTNPVEDMKGFKKAMMRTEEEGATGVKIPGVVSATFKTNTLKRV